MNTTQTLLLTPEELNDIFSAYVGRPVLIDLGLPLNEDGFYEMDVDEVEPDDISYMEEWPEDDLTGDYESLHRATFMQSQVNT